MANKNEPIMQSFLDLDHYKITMGQFVFHRYADVPVKYAFRNRTKNVKIAEIVDEKELRRELDQIQQLKPTKEEITYLGTLKNNSGRLCQEDYLNFLSTIQLPEYSLNKTDGNFEMEFSGPWSTAIYCETMALSVMNELYYRSLLKNMDPDQIREIYQTGRNNLENKITLLNQNSDIRFLEFGTRRRFSKDWQDYVIGRLKEKVPTQMTGTSNVHFAMKYGLEPKGTMAHEMFMIMSGIMHGSDDEIRASHGQVLREWWDEYGYDLSIALTDTYGSEFFFNDLTEEQAKNWKGFRQDSGSPSYFGNKQIKFYQEKGIDPTKKLFVPSDGLEPEKIVALQKEFGGRIIPSYGWGTNLTNDLGLKSLSLVVKATESCGHGTVKLSDNPAKTMGNPEDVERFMRIFNYDPKKYSAEECKY